jgi:hypothetical protein
VLQQGINRFVQDDPVIERRSLTVIADAEARNGHTVDRATENVDVLKASLLDAARSAAHGCGLRPDALYGRRSQVDARLRQTRAMSAEQVQ